MAIGNLWQICSRIKVLFLLRIYSYNKSLCQTFKFGSVQMCGFLDVALARRSKYVELCALRAMEVPASCHFRTESYPFFLRLDFLSLRIETEKKAR